MEVRIGVVYTARELVLEMNDSAEAVSAAIETALREQAPLLWLTDAKGRRVGVPTDKVAYVEVASDLLDRKVGFGSG